MAAFMRNINVIPHVVQVLAYMLKTDMSTPPRLKLSSKHKVTHQKWGQYALALSIFAKHLKLKGWITFPFRFELSRSSPVSPTLVYELKSIIVSILSLCDKKDFKYWFKDALDLMCLLVWLFVITSLISI